MKEFEMAGSPIIYLISDGTLTDETFAARSIATLETLRLAAEAGVTHFQIREKRLSAKNLFTLAAEAVVLARNSNTKIMVNDRADVAAAAGASGVQLTEDSLPTDVIRRSFPGLIIGVSTHSPASVTYAAKSGADFALFGPVFDSPGKEDLQGLEKLRIACNVIPGFPVIAVGGIDQTNFQRVLDAGAAGFAAIRFLNNTEQLKKIKAMLMEVHV